MQRLTLDVPELQPSEHLVEQMAALARASTPTAPKAIGAAKLAAAGIAVGIFSTGAAWAGGAVTVPGLPTPDLFGPQKPVAPAPSPDTDVTPSAPASVGPSDSGRSSEPAPTKPARDHEARSHRDGRPERGRSPENRRDQPKRPPRRRPDRPDADRPGGPSLPNESSRPQRPDRPVPPIRPQRPDRPERPDRPARPTRPEKPKGVNG